MPKSKQRKVPASKKKGSRTREQVRRAVKKVGPMHGDPTVRDLLHQLNLSVRRLGAAGKKAAGELVSLGEALRGIADECDPEGVQAARNQLARARAGFHGDTE